MEYILDKADEALVVLQVTGGGVELCVASNTCTTARKLSEVHAPPDRLFTSELLDVANNKKHLEFISIHHILLYIILSSIFSNFNLKKVTVRIRHKLKIFIILGCIL